MIHPPAPKPGARGWDAGGKGLRSRVDGAVGREASPRMELDDERLVEQCRAGDLAAFDRLVRRHYDSIYAVARRLLPCPDDALDVTQEVFIAAWTQLDGFRGGAAFRTWLHAIALRQCAQQ